MFLNAHRKSNTNFHVYYLLKLKLLKLRFAVTRKCQNINSSSKKKKKDSRSHSRKLTKQITKAAPSNHQTPLKGQGFTMLILNDNYARK